MKGQFYCPLCAKNNPILGARYAHAGGLRTRICHSCWELKEKQKEAGRANPPGSERRAPR